MNYLLLLDPDRRWFSVDKFEHGFLSLLVCLFPLGMPLLFLHGPLWVAPLGAILFGIGWEGGQADSAKGIPELHQGTLLTEPVKTGYGFGLLDLVWDAGGALIGYGMLLVLRIAFHL